MMDDHTEYNILPRMMIIAIVTIMAMMITRPLVAYLILQQ
jgi:hypothetical protein